MALKWQSNSYSFVSIYYLQRYCNSSGEQKKKCFFLLAFSRSNKTSEKNTITREKQNNKTCSQTYQNINRGSETTTKTSILSRLIILYLDKKFGKAVVYLTSSILLEPLHKTYEAILTKYWQPTFLLLPTANPTK